MSEQPFILSTAHERIGENLGVSDWVSIDQVQVNVFGEVTRWRMPGHNINTQSDIDHPISTNTRPRLLTQEFLTKILLQSRKFFQPDKM